MVASREFRTTTTFGAATTYKGIVICAVASTGYANRTVSKPQAVTTERKAKADMAPFRRTKRTSYRVCYTDAGTFTLIRVY